MIIALTVATLIALLGGGWLLETRGERADARRFPPLGRFVDMGAHRLHVVHKGPARGPTVVIEQGAGAACILWWLVIERIAEFAGVCAYDRAGIGESDPVLSARTPQQSADELHILLDRAGIPGPYILVAHSYGGLIARLFARDHRHEVAGLVLVDTIEEGVHFQPDVLRLYRRFTPLLALLALAARFGVQRVVARLSRPEESPLPAEIRGRMAALGQSPKMFRAMRADMRSLHYYDPAMRQPGATGSLADLPLTVITHGQPFPGPFAVLERYWRDGQQRLAALSTNGALVIAQNSNHMIQADEPEVVVDAVRRVYESASARASTVRACAPSSV